MKTRKEEDTDSAYRSHLSWLGIALGVIIVGLALVSGILMAAEVENHLSDEYGNEKMRWIIFMTTIILFAVLLVARARRLRPDDNDPAPY